MRCRISMDWGKVSSLAAALSLALPAFGVSCMTESQMSAAQRTNLQQSAQMLGDNVKTANAAAVRTQTIATVAAQFDGIADSIQTINSSIQHAALTVDAVYLLDASDLKAAQETQFFCGVTGSPLTVEITIPALPPGKYALAILHATGVQQPQQLSLVLENDPAGGQDWKLAGFFTRPMMMGGHDGVWFWTQARDYAAKKQLWDAWFYYQTAEYLLDPVDFVSSPNLQKLQREAEQARPDNLPGSDPLHLSSGTQTFDIVSLHTGELSNQLDLVVTYNASPNQDPVTARAQVTAVMRALLQQHPELLTAFHGLWVYAATPGNQSPFALELPMDQIKNSAPPPGQHS